MENLFAGDNLSQFDLIVQAERYALDHNQRLLLLMNNLTSLLEQMTKEKTGKIRRYQAIAAALALINFLVILFQLFKRLRSSSRNVLFLNNIMNNVDVSILTLD